MIEDYYDFPMGSDFCGIKAKPRAEGARHIQERNGQRQACWVRLSDAVPATATAVTAIASGVGDRRNPRFPRNARSGRQPPGVFRAIGAALVLRGPCSVDLHGQLANPMNEVRAQVFRSIHDVDLEVALQDLFPQDAQL
jgi:hypothetical protein